MLSAMAHLKKTSDSLNLKLSISYDNYIWIIVDFPRIWLSSKMCKIMLKVKIVSNVGTFYLSLKLFFKQVDNWNSCDQNKNVFSRYSLKCTQTTQGQFVKLPVQLPRQVHLRFNHSKRKEVVAKYTTDRH